MKYHITTFGCQMNDADSRYLAGELETLGHTWAPSPEDADLAVLNTCVVREHAENRAYGQLARLHQLKRRRPTMIVAVMGCLVGVRGNPDLARRFPWVDVFMGPSQTHPLLKHLGYSGVPAEFGAGNAPDGRFTPPCSARYRLPNAAVANPAVAYVPAVLGCSHTCAFCVVPYRRGPERSRPLEEILAEVRALVAQGVREVTLLGQIINRYGLDLPGAPDLADLLRAVARVDGLYRVRFLTGHPNWMTDKLLDAVATEPKICPHIELAAQSGNDKVLARMRRGYTASQFRNVVEKIRRRIPAVAIHTDIIVGFPGESEEQFMDSYRLLEDLRFDKVHVAMYSPRPHTYAAQAYRDDVPPEEKARRHRALEELQTRIQAEKNAQLRGQTVEVLVEDGHRGHWRGRTPQNRLVFFENGNDWQGRLARVKVERTGPFALVGKLADGT